MVLKTSGSIIFIKFLVKSESFVELLAIGEVK